MGIIDRLRAAITPTSRATEMIQSQWSDNSHLGDITLESLYGLVDARPLTRNRAIKIAAVSKARRIIATRIGALPIVAVKGSQELAVQPPLLAQPEPGLARSTTITWTADALFFHGRAFWQVTQRGADGFPVFVRWVPEGHAGVNNAGQLDTAFGTPVAPADSIRFDAPDAGILTDASDTLRRALALNRSASKAEDNPVPIVNLKNNGEDLTNEEIDAMIERFETKRKQSAVGYTSRGLEVQTFGAPPENLLIDARKTIILEIARHTGIPAGKLDAAIEGTALTYTNRVTENQQLIDEVLQPYMTAISDRLSMDDMTPHGTTVRFNTDTLTTPDIATRYDYYATGIDAGIITAAEAREAEGMKPLDAPAFERDRAEK